MFWEIIRPTKDKLLAVIVILATWWLAEELQFIVSSPISHFIFPEFAAALDSLGDATADVYAKKASQAYVATIEKCLAEGAGILPPIKLCLVISLTYLTRIFFSYLGACVVLFISTKRAIRIQQITAGDAGHQQRGQRA